MVGSRRFPQTFSYEARQLCRGGRVMLQMLIYAAMLAAVSVAMPVKAQMSDVDKIVLDGERPLLLQTLKLCGSADIQALNAAIPAFSQTLRETGIVPDRFDAELVSKGMVNFSAWGFNGDAPAPLKDRAFFIAIRMQESSDRTVSFCQVTDMTTDPNSTALSHVEADWLKAISPWTSAPSAKHEIERAETATEDATFERYFDISTADAIQSISLLRVGHKIEMTMMRATAK